MSAPVTSQQEQAKFTIGQWVIAPNARSYRIINIAGDLAILQGVNSANCVNYKLDQLKCCSYR